MKEYRVVQDDMTYRAPKVRLTTDDVDLAEQALTDVLSYWVDAWIEEREVSRWEKR